MLEVDWTDKSHLKSSKSELRVTWMLQFSAQSLSATITDDDDNLAFRASFTQVDQIAHRISLDSHQSIDFVKSSSSATSQRDPKARTSRKMMASKKGPHFSTLSEIYYLENLLFLLNLLAPICTLLTITLFTFGFANVGKRPKMLNVSFLS